MILYGDNNNWFATYAFWLLKLYGHANVRLMNGGRAKWVAEGLALSTEAALGGADSLSRPRIRKRAEGLAISSRRAWLAATGRW